MAYDYPDAPPYLRPPSLPPDGRDDRSLGTLLKELATETQTLVRQEVELAKTELAHKAKQAGGNAGLLVAGGFVAYAGLVVMLVAIGLLLGTFLPLWLGMGIAALGALGIGYATAQKGLEGLKNTDFKLDRTAETLSEDKQWMSKEAREVKADPAHLGSQPNTRM